MIAEQRDRGGPTATKRQRPRRHPRRALLVVAVGVAVGAAVGTGCDREAGTSGSRAHTAATASGQPRGAPAVRPQRVVLISIDTLRADALGAYGSDARATANLDRLAAEGVRFANCVAPSPLTLPSHATLLTGLHPLEHGLLVNSQSALAPDVGTLAEAASAAGWKTGAIVSSGILHHRYGLDRGFGVYRDDLAGDSLGAGDAGGITASSARDTTLAAIGWLSEQPLDARLFLFVHYIDPHAPYAPPPRFARTFPKSPYLGEVAFTDAWVGRLAEFLQDNHLMAGTLFVVTSDHGEALGQHGLPTHGYFLYDEVLRVPLIFAGTGVESGVVVEDPVGLIDVAPTLRTLMGLPPTARPSAGRDLFDVTAADRSLVSASYEPALTYGWSPLWSLSLPGEKFILAPTPEYYRTDTDPGELENLASEAPERVEALERALRDRASAYLSRRRTAAPLGLDTATALQLAALGYAEASVSASDVDLEDFSGRDPKEMRDIILRMDAYHQAVIRGDYEAAESELEDIARRDPDNPVVARERSMLLLLAGREEELLSWSKEQPAAIRESATQRYRRAVALGRLGRSEDAIELLRLTLADVPADGPSRFELAKLLSLSARPSDAQQQYEELLRQDPRHREARLNYASLLRDAGDRLRAVQELRLLVELHPRYARAHRNLGLLLASLHQRVEAIAMLERAIELAPDAANRPRTEEIIAELRAMR